MTLLRGKNMAAHIKGLAKAGVQLKHQPFLLLINFGAVRQ